MHVRHSRAAGVHVFNPTVYGSPLREDDEVIAAPVTVHFKGARNTQLLSRCSESGKPNF